MWEKFFVKFFLYSQMRKYFGGYKAWNGRSLWWLMIYIKIVCYSPRGGSLSLNGAALFFIVLFYESKLWRMEKRALWSRAHLRKNNGITVEISGKLYSNGFSFYRLFALLMFCKFSDCETWNLREGRTQTNCKEVVHKNVRIVSYLEDWRVPLYCDFTSLIDVLSYAQHATFA